MQHSQTSPRLTHVSSDTAPGPRSGFIRVENRWFMVLILRVSVAIVPCRAMPCRYAMHVYKRAVAGAGLAGAK